MIRETLTLNVPPHRITWQLFTTQSQYVSTYWALACTPDVVIHRKHFIFTVLLIQFGLPAVKSPKWIIMGRRTGCQFAEYLSDSSCSQIVIVLSDQWVDSCFHVIYHIYLTISAFTIPHFYHRYRHLHFHTTPHLSLFLSPSFCLSQTLSIFSHIPADLGFWCWSMWSYKQTTRACSYPR